MRWPLGVLLLLYVALVIYRIPAVGEKQRADEAVARIHAAKLTLDTVMGEHLPLPPNEEVNNATVAGVDNNQNGIRDDVELAIFAKYPDSAKIRAAELQYAMTEQMFLTEVFNTNTWEAVAEEDGRANFCISETAAHPTTTDSQEIWTEWDNLINGRIKEVEKLVLNTTARKDAKTKAFNFITSNGSAPGSACDIDLETLPN